MIRVIMDNSSKEKIDRYNKLGYEVNNLVLKKAQEKDPEKTFHQVNWSMILKKDTSCVIFDIEKGYNNTKSMIYGALKHNVPVIALLKGQRYNLNPSILYEPTRDAFDNFIPNEYTTLLEGLKNLGQDAMDEEDVKTFASGIDFVQESAKLLGIELPELEVAVAYINTYGHDHDVYLEDELDINEVMNKYITVKYYKQLDMPVFNPEDKCKCPVCGHWNKRTQAIYGMLNCNFCGTDISKDVDIIIESFGKEGLYED